MEHIREAHTILEASTAKREQLEMAMRRKLEAELRKAREGNLQLKGTNKQSFGHLSHTGNPLRPNVQYEHFCSKMSPAVWTTTIRCKQTKFQFDMRGEMSIPTSFDTCSVLSKNW